MILESKNDNYQINVLFAVKKILYYHNIEKDLKSEYNLHSRHFMSPSLPKNIFEDRICVTTGIIRQRASETYVIIKQIEIKINLFTPNPSRRPLIPRSSHPTPYCLRRRNRLFKIIYVSRIHLQLK